MRRLIFEAPEEHKDWRLERLIEDRCKSVVLAHIRNAHERAEKNFYSPVVRLAEPECRDKFYTRGADELLEDKMYRIAES